MYGVCMLLRQGDLQKTVVHNVLTTLMDGRMDCARVWIWPTSKASIQ